MQLAGLHVLMHVCIIVLQLQLDLNGVHIEDHLNRNAYYLSADNKRFGVRIAGF